MERSDGTALINFLGLPINEEDLFNNYQNYFEHKF